MGAEPETILTPQQAEMLLAPLGDVSVVDVTVAATTNDVFKVRTREHGTYYVKFHTAPWYSDHPDAYFAVERECAVCDLLGKRGLPMPYRFWGDYTRQVVSRSVFISEELGGISVPEALQRFPDQQPGILQALGRYLRSLHSIEFARAGFIARPHAVFAPAAGPVPLVYTWDRQAYQRPDPLQKDAIEGLEQRAALLPADVVPRLRELFESLAEVVHGDYHPPRFTIANCHAHHFHVDKRNGDWEVLGFYDFEAASAGCPICDLVELEVALTPATRGTAWRDPFFESYGSWPSFESYKLRTFSELLFQLGWHQSEAVPDSKWLYEAWPRLIDAADWPELEWYPEPDSGVTG